MGAIWVLAPIAWFLGVDLGAFHHLLALTVGTENWIAY
jgi:hypothetical protein